MLSAIKLAELMKEKGIKSMYELSIQTEIPYSTLNYMISGHDMYVGTLLIVAKFFDVSLEELLDIPYGIVNYKENGENEYHDTRSYSEFYMS